jgi:hypothetical protein
MKNSRLFCVMCAAMALVSAQAGPSIGQTRTPPQSTTVGSAVTLRQGGAITGTAWMYDNSPIVNGLLRLRNLTTGRIVQGTQSDAQGRFAFGAVPAGNYLVELVDGSGGIRAVGQMFTVNSGETVATFIRLGARGGWFDGFFGNAAAAAVSAAASLGLTAVGTGGQPASPRF